MCVHDFCRSSGLLIYAALVDLLAEDFLSHEAGLLTKKQKILGFIYVLLGGKSGIACLDLRKFKYFYHWLTPPPLS